MVVLNKKFRACNVQTLKLIHHDKAGYADTLFFNRCSSHLTNMFMKTIYFIKKGLLTTLPVLLKAAGNAKIVFKRYAC